MSKPLTKLQIKRLQHGDHVTIIWSGGNGPHNYRVFRLDGGLIFAATEREFQENTLPAPDRQLDGLLSFTGQEKPFTMIFKKG